MGFSRRRRNQASKRFGAYLGGAFISPMKKVISACQQMDIYGVNERVSWKARPDERLVVFDMFFKKSEQVSLEKYWRLDKFTM